MTNFPAGQKYIMVQMFLNIWGTLLNADRQNGASPPDDCLGQLFEE